MNKPRIRRVHMFQTGVHVWGVFGTPTARRPFMLSGNLRALLNKLRNRQGKRKLK